MSAGAYFDSLRVPERQVLGFGEQVTTRKGRQWGNFHWYPGGKIARVCRTMGARGAEHAHRLLTWTPSQAEELGRSGRSGGLNSACSALGFMVDVDVAQRRVGDRRGYVPTHREALALVSEVGEPTWALDTGGGLVCVFLFERPLGVGTFEEFEEDGAENFDVMDRDLSVVAKRLTATVARVVEGAGYEFDSPHGATSWVRCPGSPTKYGDHRVTVLHEGVWWSLEQVESVATARPKPGGHGYATFA